MAAATITALQTRILGELNKNSSDYGAYVISAIVAAIRLYEGRRFWFLEKNSTITLLSAGTSVALPTDFKSLIKIRLLRGGYYYGQDSGFESEDYTQLKETFLDPARTQYPTKYAIFANTVYVNFTADQDYTLDIDYCKGDAAYPASGSDSSVWFDDGVELIRTKALAILWRDVLHDEERAVFYDGGMDMNGEGGQVGIWLKELTRRSNQREARYRLK